VNGEFPKPAGLTIDFSENVYVTDQRNGWVQKFTSDGHFIAAWGTTGKGKGQFSEPEGIDVDNSDHIYVAETGNNCVGVFVEEAVSTNAPNMSTRYDRHLTFIVSCLKVYNLILTDVYQYRYYNW
jgi:DNA-binding beta-propeller fold protein YncE